MATTTGLVLRGVQMCRKGCAAACQVGLGRGDRHIVERWAKSRVAGEEGAAAAPLPGCLTAGRGEQCGGWVVGRASHLEKCPAACF